MTPGHMHARARTLTLGEERTHARKACKLESSHAYTCSGIRTPRRRSILRTVQENHIFCAFPTKVKLYYYLINY